VEGRLRTREYEARDNASKRSRTEIIAQRVQFLGSRPDLSAGGEGEEPAASEEAPF
jgi:single-stranded DNA-binding protein